MFNKIKKVKNKLDQDLVSFGKRIRYNLKEDQQRLRKGEIGRYETTNPLRRRK